MKYFCLQCGNNVFSEDRYCYNCGTILHTNEILDFINDQDFYNKFEFYEGMRKNPSRK